MKNLKDIILEKLKVTKSSTSLDIINDPKSVVDYLYSDDISKRQEAINCIKEEILISNCKQLKTTNTVKNSTANFIQLSKIHIDDDTPNCITICRRQYGTNYLMIYIIADNNPYNKQPNRHINTWSNIQPNLSPKTQELYEIPSDSILNLICTLIRENYK